MSRPNNYQGEKILNNSQLRKIDGDFFEKIVESGALNLKANIQIVNELNVFPIPDGDTGDNMYMTISGGVGSLKREKTNSVSQKAKALADGMLLSARGNSGVILSQFFAGMADGLKGYDEVTVTELGGAFKCGVCKAYKAVAKPVEGTMLTVVREATDYACLKCADNSTIGGFFDNYLAEMRASLDRTPTLLEVLREAGVTDSGGAGLVYIAEGMKAAVDGKEIIAGEEFSQNKANVDFSRFNENTKMEFGYCTEILLQLTRAKTNIEEFDLNALIDFLESVGDSVVAFLTGSVVKLHVHTLTPDKVLSYCLNYGEFLTLKVENMTLQHNGIEVKEEKRKPLKRAKIRLVTVATGKGLIDAFKELGADDVIDGGQGKNPSIERFIESFDYLNADTIFVLPNNGNILLAAKQAASIYDKSHIEVIETKNLGQAYSVLSMLDYKDGDTLKIAKQMREDMQSVVTGMVTSSIRDANIDGVKIENGDFIGFCDKTMLSAGKDKVEVTLDLAQKLNANEKSFIIACFGGNITDKEKSDISSILTKTYLGAEYYSFDGGQEVYDVILIME